MGDGRAPFDGIGKAVREVLEDGGRSQKWLADASGVGYPKLRQWLSGRRGIRSDDAAKCLDALGLEVRPIRDRGT